MVPIFSIIYREVADKQIEMHFCLYDSLLSRIHGGDYLQWLRLHKSNEERDTVDMVYTCTNGYNGNLYLDTGDTMQFFMSENDDNERHVLSTQRRDPYKRRTYRVETPSESVTLIF